MIKAAMEYVKQLASPTIHEINGQTYTDKSLHRVSFRPKASEITLTTLKSLVDYIKSNIDLFSEKMLVHIESPTRVRFFSGLDEERDREYIASVEASIPSFPFDNFIDHEKFCINVQSKFADNEDKALILKFAGTVESGTVTEYGDDGISQKATVKTGLATKSDALVPGKVVLKPFRTFVEVEQPASEFIFRMKQEKYDGISCGIFEADGGAWKLYAMNNIKTYLAEELKDYEGITIIS